MSNLTPFQFFNDHIGAQIQLHHDQDAFSAKIAEVNLLNNTKSTDAQPFSVILHSNCPGDVQQGMFVGKHEKLGELSLFLVPVGDTEDGLVLEGVFN